MAMISCVFSKFVLDGRAAKAIPGYDFATLNHTEPPLSPLKVNESNRQTHT